MTSEDESDDSSLVTRHSSLETELKALVAKDMGKPLAPSKIHFVSALPKTRNAKVMRRVIRSAYLGEDPGDLSALEDQGAFAAIAQLAKAVFHRLSVFSCLYRVMPIGLPRPNACPPNA